MEMKVKAIAPWFGSNRSLAQRFAAELEGCKWVGVPFAGGMSELPYIKARTILVNDLHRHVINLARVISHDDLRGQLVRFISRKCFHPDELKLSQEYCSSTIPRGDLDLETAQHYFVCCWMGRSHIAGNKYEFTGKPSIRWNCNGGDSATRYRNVIKSIAAWSRVMKKCTFQTLDCEEFIESCHDKEGHGLFIDPPFPVVGNRYKHSMTLDEHSSFAKCVTQFSKTRVVCRFYDTPFIREIYPEHHWNILSLKGGKTQSNKDAPEILIINGPEINKQQSLF